MKKLLLFLATVAVATSCEKEIISDVAVDSNESKQITVSASTEGVATRVSVTGNEAKGFDVEWLESDELGAWAWIASAEEGPYNNTSFNEFEIDAFNATNSTFTGSISHASDDNDVRFIHPYTTTALDKFIEKDIVASNGNTYKNKFYYGFDINLSAQKAGALNENTYMISNTVSYADVETAQLSMSHIGAMMELNFKAIEGYTLTKVVVKDIPAIASIDLREEEDYLTKTQNSDVTITDVESNTVAFNILPFTVAKDAALTVVSYYKNGDNYYSATTAITASKDVEFARATRNSINVMVVESDLVAEQAPAVLTETKLVGTDFLSGSYDDNDGEGTYKGITLEVANCYNNNSGIQVKNSEGYFYNTVALNGLAEIEVVLNTEKSSNMPTIFAGETENPTEAVAGVNGVFTIPAGSKYFKVAAENGYVVMLSITFKYESIEGVEASVDSVDPTALAFDKAGETLTAEINGVMLNTVELEAISSNDHFTASIEGTTLSVTALENTGEAQQTGTVTVRIKGDTEGGVEVAVSQKGTASVEELVDTILGVHIKSGSYNSDSFTTDAGLNYSYDKCFRGTGTCIQMNTGKNQSALYNTTAVEGMSKIVITLASGPKKFAVSAGTASYGSDKSSFVEITPTTNDDGNDEYLIPAGSTYLMVESTGGAVYASSFKIYAIK